jgi:hypothetical protein
MPKHKIHRLIDKIFLGEEFPDVHVWIDKPYKYLGRKHRILRHTPISIVAKYGFTNRKTLSGLLHILDDFGSSKVKKKKWEQQKISGKSGKEDTEKNLSQHLHL